MTLFTSGLIWEDVIEDADWRLFKLVAHAIVAIVIAAIAVQYQPTLFPIELSDILQIISTACLPKIIRFNVINWMNRKGGNALIWEATI